MRLRAIQALKNADSPFLTTGGGFKFGGAPAAAPGALRSSYFYESLATRE